jgi:tetratricopeptide (TPR) repeat protein
MLHAHYTALERINNPSQLGHKAKFLQSIGKHELALKLYSEAIRKTNNFRDTSLYQLYLNREDLYWSLGNKAMAKSDYVTAERLIHLLSKPNDTIPKYVEFIIDHHREP